MSESRSMRALIDRTQNIPPMLLTADEASVALRLAPNTIHNLIRTGALRCVLVPLGDKRQVRRIAAVELQAFVDRLVAEQLSPAMNK